MGLNHLRAKRAKIFETNDLHIVGKCPFCEEFDRGVYQREDERRTLISILRARKLRYFGHLIRLNYVYRTLLEGYIDRERGRGFFFIYVIKILQYILRSTLLTRITLQYYWDKTPGEQEAVSTPRELT